MSAEDKLFRTVVDVPRWRNPIEASQRFVLLGSCFAQNMGERFQGYGLNAICNPLGVTYNPESVLRQVRQALTGEAVLPIFKAADEWRCWWAGTLIGATDEAACREVAGGAFGLLGEALRQADVLFVTLGSNVCYKLCDSGMTVTNCHKMPDRLFREERLDYAACTAALDEMVELLQRHCPGLRIVLTVSPYRYRKYGYHGSQIAKATLLLAVEALCQRWPETVSYFPAYEIVMDELRDYRFYADDMIHPSAAAVSYIWERLVESAMSQDMQRHLKEYEPIRRAAMHRPNKKLDRTCTR